MNEVVCLAEQVEMPAWTMLRATATVDVRPVAEVTASGWHQPLLVSGDALRGPAGLALLRRAYRNPAPLMILPPLPVGDITEVLGAAAPVQIVRQRSEQVSLTDLWLRQAVGRDDLRVLCTEAIETALRAGELAAASEKPVLWAFQPTRGATPVLFVAVQVLLASARTDPLDREDLLSALLTWANTHTAREPATLEPDTGNRAADASLMRALVVAWSVRPDLSGEELVTWLRQWLAVDADQPGQLAAAVEMLRALEALDVEGRPQQARVGALAADWGLRAWVREARRMEADG